MADGTLLCSRCGVVNTAGDQFCGSCGAFLEWEGVATDEVRADSRSADATVVTAPVPVTLAPPALPAPPAPARADPTPTPAPGSIACPSCGTSNPAQRTFCQSCGTDLRSKARASSLTGPAPAGSRPSAPKESGGLPFWLPIVLGIGLLAGVIVVVAPIVLRPAGLESAATSAPSVTFTPTLSPPHSPSAASSDGSSGLPVGPIPLTLTGATASSVVGDREKFAADKAIDGSIETCWQEGSDEEAGEWIEVTLAPSRLDYIVIYSGYQLDHDAYLGNRRPENVIITVNGGPPVAFVLADSEQPQRLDLDDTPGATTIRVQIASAFGAVATAYPDSPFDDVAISEIRAYGVVGG